MTGPGADSASAAPRPAADAGGKPTAQRPDTVGDTTEFSRPQLDEHTARETTVFSRPQVDESTAQLRVGPTFRVGWRGYDQGQVDTYRSRVEADLNSIRQAHERAVRAHAQIAEQLRAAQAELTRVRAQRIGSPSALSERLREILDLAAQEAQQTRMDGQNEADQIRATASNDAQAVVRQARRTAENIIAEARSEHQRLSAEVEQARVAGQRELEAARAEQQRERERADAEAAARREAADRAARERREREDAAAAARIAEMNQHLAELTKHRDETLAALAQLHQSLAQAVQAPQPTAPEPSE